MIFGIWNIFLSIVGIVCFLIALGRWKDSYFRYRGVQIIPTYFPVIGQLFNILRKKEHIKDISQRVYTAFEGERYIGMYSFLQPMVVLRDLELIKQLTIKDFDHFTDHMIKEDTDPLFGNNLFSLKGQKWREMRMNLSPAFTSSKMRTMFDFVAEIGEQMSDYYVREMEKEENRVRGLIELEMKDAFTRYTNDVIATAAFGIKVNSFENRENEFYRMGKEATDFIGAGFFRFFLIIALPRIAKMFDITLFSKKISNFYRHLVLNAMKQREDENIVRPDMIQLLMEARKGALKHEEEKGEGKETGFATVEESTLGMQASKRSKPMYTENHRVSERECMKGMLWHEGEGREKSTACCCGGIYIYTEHHRVTEKVIKKKELKYEEAKEGKEAGFATVEKFILGNYTRTIKIKKPTYTEHHRVIERVGRKGVLWYEREGSSACCCGGVYIYTKHHRITERVTKKRKLRYDEEANEGKEAVFATVEGFTLGKHNIKRNKPTYTEYHIITERVVRKGVLRHVEGEREDKEALCGTVEEPPARNLASKKNWTDDELVAQAVLFLSAGFDTSSLLICFAAHEMVIHPEIQRKLQEEIDEVAAKNNGKITYNDLQNMKYMDMVISETLRKWPPSVAIDRKCVKSIKIPPPNDNSDSDDFEIKVGDGIWIPVYPIHHDSKYFKNPEVFDPERFSDENKDDIKPFTYLPFGIGPRNCIGSRFALMEAKAAIFHLLHKFDLVPTAKTQNPIKIDNAAFILQPERGFWMGLKPRNK